MTDISKQLPEDIDQDEDVDEALDEQDATGEGFGQRDIEDMTADRKLNVRLVAGGLAWGSMGHLGPYEIRPSREGGVGRSRGKSVVVSLSPMSAVPAHSTVG